MFRSKLAEWFGDIWKRKNSELVFLCFGKFWRGLGFLSGLWKLI